MRIGVVSDIHSNLVALEAVLADMPAVDQLVCAGDVVGYNPWPAACVDTLRERGVPTVMGNHDRMVATGQNFQGNGMAQAGIEHAVEELHDVQRTWIENRPAEQRLADGRVRVIHDHPEFRDKYTYPDEFEPSLLGRGTDDDTPIEDVLILGHTHVQHHETYAAGIVMNPGSVGQPRDEDPRAAYAVVDVDDLSVTEHRVEYDIDAVQAAVSDAGLPARTADRLASGR
ncbi:metallophosphoesterase family protein [Halobacterium salinarum]|uniref:DNA repair protein n=4 Tax=Halobacterium salinarum TaxID=2242 RepID=Q9HMV3_HALSA|nr:metallophosphoesterase family protein [Halobacterium salinarum]AAG20468.1 DNA repair protein [Halobacterium salinarum NRC-1]MBB6089601.1 putative phosphodiesterase [Halobacterium salinarum]MCF2164349.1 metallophosphatase family protein [Halobacterium salinarum]MCF2167136.1 metallophosphatase family protein [Halobacterium salinarum]MCF2239085.1 metallophosphatase family protein [Halobacterium salinarum]